MTANGPIIVYTVCWNAKTGFGRRFGPIRSMVHKEACRRGDMGARLSRTSRTIKRRASDLNIIIVKMKAFALVLALTTAALVQGNAFHCEKKETGTLVGYVANTSGKKHGHEQPFAFKHNLMYTSDKEGEEVEFWECKVPSDKYGCSKDNKMFGMLKRKSNPSMCVTSGRVLRGMGPKEHGYSMAFTTIPKGASDAVSWKPCATKESLRLRLQWFSLERHPQNGCSPKLSMEGFKSDSTMTLITGDKNRASFDLVHPSQEMRSHAFLKTGKLGNECI